jgi:hypothetical protein
MKDKVKAEPRSFATFPSAVAWLAIAFATARLPRHSSDDGGSRPPPSAHAQASANNLFCSPADGIFCLELAHCYPEERQCEVASI